MGSLPIRSHPCQHLPAQHRGRVDANPNQPSEEWMQRFPCFSYCFSVFVFCKQAKTRKRQSCGKITRQFFWMAFQVYIRDVVKMEEKNVNFLHMHLHFSSVQ